MALKSGGNAADKIAVGTTPQRPNSPVQGDLRFGLDSQHPEIYTGTLSRVSGWKLIAYVQSPSALPNDLNLSGSVSANVNYYCNNLNIANNTSIKGYHTTFVCTGNVTIGNNVTFDFNSGGPPGTGGDAITANEVDPIPGNGLSPGTPSVYRTSPPVSIFSYASAGGASGGKPQGVDGTNSVGGPGGGSITIQCDGSMTIGTGCKFLANGGAGFVDTSAGKPTYGGGGGGGAGGFVVLQSHGDFAMGSGGQMTANGGKGRDGLRGRGSTGGGGGGGGSGGYVVIGASEGSFTMSTTNVTVNGGAPGRRPFGNGGKRGGGGAACGGRGGNLASGYDGTAGQKGQYLKDFILGK